MTFNLYLICPLIAALGWGLLYAVEGKIYRFVSIPTNFLMFALANVCSAFLLAFCFKMPIDFSPYAAHPQRLLAWLVLPLTMIGTIFLHLTIKNVSPTYGALGEISYVLLTPLFAWLMFGQKQLNQSMLIGAAFILAGLYFVISGQTQKSALPGA